MKVLICALLAVSTVAVSGVAMSGSLAYSQQQSVQPADALGKLSFMQGDWGGKQYICEMLSTTLPGRKPTDTRHFISFDAKTQKYTAWWFNDTSYHPTALTGDLTGNKLVLMSDPAAPGPLLRATYENPSASTLTYMVEMKNGDNWTKLFLTTYTKKTVVAKP